MMEADNRKKRVVTRGEVGEGKTNRSKKSKGEEEGSGADNGAGDAAVVPTEDEVEEFFAILRRMRVAVKYFGEKGGGGKEWREVLEQAEFTVEDDDNAVVDDDSHRHREVGCGAVQKNKGDEEIIINEGLDLNVVAPEADDGGDA